MASDVPSYQEVLAACWRAWTAQLSATGWSLKDGQITGFPRLDVRVANHQLIELFLTNRKLAGAVPPEIGLASHLQFLSLTNNNLTVLPREFGNLSSLQELCLDNNELTELPREFGNLSSLQELSLRYNNLAKLPQEFGNLSSLRVLFLRNNELRDLPEEFGNLSSLQELNLDNNKLSKLPQAFGNLLLLRRLHLDSNELRELPEEFGNLSSLQKLDLVNNELIKLPQQFSNLSSLRVLYLRKNKLTELPSEFANLSSLQELSLSNNELTELPQEFRNLTSLRVLQLTNNRLFPELVAVLPSASFILGPQRYYSVEWLQYTMQLRARRLSSTIRLNATLLAATSEQLSAKTRAELLTVDVALVDELPSLHLNLLVKEIGIVPLLVKEWSWWYNIQELCNDPKVATAVEHMSSVYFGYLTQCVPLVITPPAIEALFAALGPFEWPNSRKRPSNLLLQKLFLLQLVANQPYQYLPSNLDLTTFLLHLSQLSLYLLPADSILHVRSIFRWVVLASPSVPFTLPQPILLQSDEFVFGRWIMSRGTDHLSLSKRRLFVEHSVFRHLALCQDAPMWLADGLIVDVLNYAKESPKDQNFPSTWASRLHDSLPTFRKKVVDRSLIPPCLASLGHPPFFLNNVEIAFVDYILRSLWDLPDERVLERVQFFYAMEICPSTPGNPPRISYDPSVGSTNGAVESFSAATSTPTKLTRICSNEECGKPAILVCTDCGIDFCEQCSAEAHNETDGTSHHQKVMLPQLEAFIQTTRDIDAAKYGDARKQVTEAELIEDRKKNLFARVTPYGISSGAKYAHADQAGDASLFVVGFTGPTGSGKSFIMRRLISGEPKPLVTPVGQHGISTSADVTCYWSEPPASGMLLLDTEGYEGTQPLALSIQSAVASMAERKHVVSQFPQLLVGFVNVLCFVLPDSLKTASDYVASLISFAKQAFVGASLRARPHLIVIPSKKTIQELSISTDQWKIMFPREYVELMLYFKSIDIIPIPDISGGTERLMSSIERLQSKLLELQVSYEESIKGLQRDQTKNKAAFARAARRLNNPNMPAVRYGTASNYPHILWFNLYIYLLKQMRRDGRDLEGVISLLDQNLCFVATALAKRHGWNNSLPTSSKDSEEQVFSASAQPSSSSSVSKQDFGLALSAFKSLVTANLPCCAVMPGDLGDVVQTTGPLRCQLLAQEHGDFHQIIVKVKSPGRILSWLRGKNRDHRLHRWPGAFERAPEDPTVVTLPLIEALLEGAEIPSGQASPNLPLRSLLTNRPWPLGCSRCITGQWDSLPKCQHGFCPDCTKEMQVGKTCPLCQHSLSRFFRQMASRLSGRALIALPVPSRPTRRLLVLDGSEDFDGQFAVLEHLEARIGVPWRLLFDQIVAHPVICDSLSLLHVVSSPEAFLSETFALKRAQTIWPSCPVSLLVRLDCNRPSSPSSGYQVGGVLNEQVGPPTGWFSRVSLNSHHFFDFELLDQILEALVASSFAFVPSEQLSSSRVSSMIGIVMVRYQWSVHTPPLLLQACFENASDLVEQSKNPFELWSLSGADQHAIPISVFFDTDTYEEPVFIIAGNRQTYPGLPDGTLLVLTTSPALSAHATRHPIAVGKSIKNKYLF